MSDPAANEAVGAVRANDPWRPGRVAARRDLPLAVIPHDLAYSFGPPHDARVKRGLEQGAVEGHARRHGEVGSGIARVEDDLRAARSVFEGDVFDRHRTNRCGIDRVANELERAAGDAASAGFLPRMTSVKNRDARAGTRQPPGGAASRRSRPDDRDIVMIHFDRLTLESHNDVAPACRWRLYRYAAGHSGCPRSACGRRDPGTALDHQPQS